MNLISIKNGKFGFYFYASIQRRNCLHHLAGIFITMPLSPELNWRKLIPVGPYLIGVGYFRGPSYLHHYWLINEYFGEKALKAISINRLLSILL
jgi:hypothetical protein